MCQHLAFSAQVHVHRHVDGNKVSFTAELGVQCSECGEVFKFLGMKSGISQSKPTTSVNGTTARLPVAPAKSTPKGGEQEGEGAAAADAPVLNDGIRPPRVRKSVDEVRRPPAPVESQASPVLTPTPAAAGGAEIVADAPQPIEAQASEQPADTTPAADTPTAGTSDGVDG